MPANNLHAGRPVAKPDRALHGALQVVALVLGVVATFMGPYLYFFSVRPADALAPALVAGLAWTAIFLLRFGYSRYVPHLIVFGILFAAILGVLTFGSLRSSGVMLFVAGVAAAGVFLERGALLASVAFTCCAMAVLLWIEQHGWMHPPVMQVNATTVVVYMATFGMAEQQLYSSEVLGASIDQRRLGPSHRMGPIFGTIQTKLIHPVPENPGVLPGSEVG